MEKKIIFDGKCLWQHWNDKSQSEKKIREEFALTVLKALPVLHYESDTVGYFRLGNKIFRVVLEKSNIDEYRVKTYYKCQKLTRKYQNFRVGKEKVTIFTTRPDTLFGATYFVLSPEHPLVNQVTTSEQKDAIEAYQKECAGKSDLERTELNKDKTGVFTGAYAINPVNGKKIPVWIADYVMMSYGTGAIMAVPAHDERDLDFAKKFDLEVIEVIEGLENPFQKTGGTIKNSEFLNGLSIEDAIQKMIAWLEEKNLGKRKVNYKLRDWIFTRQRYWGEPIPLIHCEKCGVVPHDPEWAKYENFGTQKKEEEYLSLQGRGGALMSPRQIPQIKKKRNAHSRKKVGVLMPPMPIPLLSKI